MPGSLPVTITSPTGGTTINTRHRRRDRHDHGWCKGRRGSVRIPRRGGGDRFDHRGWFGQLVADLPVSFGSSTITVTATRGGSTGYAQVSVSSSAVPGTTVFSTMRPAAATTTGLARTPTRRRRASPTGRLTSPACRSTRPTARYSSRSRSARWCRRSATRSERRCSTSTSTSRRRRRPRRRRRSRSATTRSRQPTPGASGWRFRASPSPVWLDPSGNGVGSAVFVPDDGTKTATLELPIAQFGTVGSGWTFTVALTGQDGFSSDQARAFAPTPQDFPFGVCQPGGIEPDLRGGPGDGAQGDGHVHAGGRRPDDRARSDPRAGRAAGSDGAVGPT